MARPIKETPILTNSDAENFYTKMVHPKTISKQQIDKIKADSAKIKSIEK